MHDQVMVNGAVGTSSVTSIDIHDIARSARTYGLQEYGIVTPLQDQKDSRNYFRILAYSRNCLQL